MTFWIEYYPSGIDRSSLAMVSSLTDMHEDIIKLYLMNSPNSARCRH